MFISTVIHNCIRIIYVLNLIVVRICFASNNACPGINSFASYIHTDFLLNVDFQSNQLRVVRQLWEYPQMGMVEECRRRGRVRWWQLWWGWWASCLELPPEGSNRTTFVSSEECCSTQTFVFVCLTQPDRRFVILKTPSIPHLFSYRNTTDILESLWKCLLQRFGMTSYSRSEVRRWRFICARFLKQWLDDCVIAFERKITGGNGWTTERLFVVVWTCMQCGHHVHI